MNILVVGNGFDLAHNLPTRYSDFLDFMVLCIKEWGDWNKWEMKFLDENWRYYYDHILREIYEHQKNKTVQNLFKNNKKRIIDFFKTVKQLRDFYRNNIMRYCLYRYESKLSCPEGFNWIDIESELAEFIEIIRNLKYPPQKESSENYNKENGIFFSMSHQIHDEAGNQVNFCITDVEKKIRRNEIPNDMIKSFIFQTLFEELEIFDSLLIFYLQLVVDEFKKKSPKEI
ncbi:MAG: hypothetical protein IKN12_08775 [Selenomonadaceae bacterium]|nr:hypothetical protein [Selenomonadaceae bacterium]